MCLFTDFEDDSPVPTKKRKTKVQKEDIFIEVLELQKGNLLLEREKLDLEIKMLKLKIAQLEQGQ